MSHLMEALRARGFELAEAEGACNDEVALVEELYLAAHAKSALDKAGIATVQEVTDKFAVGGEAALLWIKGFGRKALNDLKQQLLARGFRLQQSTASQEAGSALMKE